MDRFCDLGGQDREGGTCRSEKRVKKNSNRLFEFSFRIKSKGNYIKFKTKVILSSEEK